MHQSLCGTSFGNRLMGEMPSLIPRWSDVNNIDFLPLLSVAAIIEPHYPERPKTPVSGILPFPMPVPAKSLPLFHQIGWPGSDPEPRFGVGMTPASTLPCHCILLIGQIKHATDAAFILSRPPLIFQ